MQSLKTNLKTLFQSAIAVLILAQSSAGNAGVLTFPTGFKWCTSTAAYQVEGNDVNSDWWAWENVPGKIKNGDHSGLADDHYNRLEEDTKLLQDLHLQAERFSVEWAKIEPQEGVIDQSVVDHYRHEIQLLKDAGIEPYITLLHYTLPQWVAAKGGWEWDGIPDAFAKFTEVVYTQIAPDNQVFITLNEPTVALLASYVVAAFPPGKSGIQALVVPMLNMLRAHGRSFHMLHERAKDSGHTVRVGMAHHLRIFDPYNKWNLLDRWGSRLIDEVFNWAFSRAAETGSINIYIPFLLTVQEKIPEAQNSQDFFGLNYYSRDMVKISLSPKNFLQLLVNPGSPTNDEGWEIYPEGFYRIIKAVMLKFPGKPIIVTENGIADATDAKRPQFILDHLRAMHRAMQEGAPIEGYCHWSLLDNFEWNSGFGPRFGLYSVDYATETRTPRPSALLYSKIAAENTIPSQ